jgi:hypothetical protein
MALAEREICSGAGVEVAAVAIGLVVEGADLGQRLAAARSAASGDCGHHGKTPFLFGFVDGHNSALGFS